MKLSMAMALVTVVMLSGCKDKPGDTDTGDDGAKQITVGYSQTGSESGWRTALTGSMKAEAEKRGVNFKFSDAQSKQENQIRAVRSFVTQGVDAIVISPIVETGWELVLKEAKEAGIPVVLLDRTVEVDDESLFACFIGSDFITEGKMAGEWLVKRTGGKANIVELQGTPGSAPANDRQTGFMDAIKGSPEMKVIASQTGNFTRAGGKEVMEAFLKRYKGQIDVLYAHNDDMALGAIQAIEEAGLKPAEDIIIVSVDALKVAFEAIVAGKLNCTVECNPLLGPDAFDTVEKLLAGEEVPKKQYVHDELFDESNAADNLPKRLY